MRIAPLILCCSVVSFTVCAQKSGQRDFELGVFGGTSWYNGDLNPNRFFDDRFMEPAYGISLRKNINRRFALKAAATRASVRAEDSHAQSPQQINRNLNFNSTVHEFSLCTEFNYHEFDALIEKYQISPYTFIGLAVFRFDPLTDVEGNVYQLQPLQTENVSYARTSVAIPFGIGVKWAMNDRMLVSTEWGLRKTFTDYLDDVSTYYPSADSISGLTASLSDRSLKQAGPDGTSWGTQRGNSKLKDWYSVVSLTVAWRLGPKKGSCKPIGRH